MTNTSSYDINAGAQNFPIYYDAKQSVLGATNITFLAVDTDGAIFEWTGVTVFGTTKFRFITDSEGSEVPSTARGTWTVQPFFTLGGKTIPGDIAKMQVGPATGAAT